MTVKKRILPILITIMMIISLMPATATRSYATYLGNNTGSIDTINEGDELNQNQGTVKKNYGSIDANMGTVTNNYNYIRVNWTNGTVSTNRGTIDTNLNTVNMNYGTIKTNTNGSIGNMSGGVVESSNGKVTNYGTVVRNWGQGTIQGTVTMYEGGHVVTNDCKVVTLKSASVVCSIENNNASFEVDKATASVTNNNADARIQVSMDGVVKVDNNAGEITLWNSVGGTNGYGGGTGYVQNNTGKVTVANGATAYIVENSGTIYPYSGSNVNVYRPCVITNNTDVEVNTGDGFTDYEQLFWVKKGATFTVADNSACVVISGATYSKNLNTYTINNVTGKVSITIQDHSYGEPVILKNATCLDVGSQRRTCSVCDFSITEKIPAKGHDWSDDYAVDKKATCTSDGTESIHCTRCTETKDSRVIPALGHNWEDDYAVDKKATCTEDGSESIHCSRCKGSKEGTVRVIKKTGHSFSKWAVTKAATEIASGVSSRKCSKCGIVEKKTISQLAPTLKAVKITKPKISKGLATVKWKKISKKDQKKIKKVEIQYSTVKKFNKGVKKVYANSKVTSKNIKGLKKGKKYYVRIRAYTKAGKTIHVSKWSTVKSFKAK